MVKTLNVVITHFFDCLTGWHFFDYWFIISELVLKSDQFNWFLDKTYIYIGQQVDLHIIILVLDALFMWNQIYFFQTIKEYLIKTVLLKSLCIYIYIYAYSAKRVSWTRIISLDDLTLKVIAISNAIIYWHEKFVL